MNPNEIIRKKRDQEELSKEEIEFFISEYSNGNIPDYQASSLLMAIYLNGMSQSEIAFLTGAMIKSGKTMDLSSIEGIKVDKHSTGGIGDKMSMVLLPLVAACGVPVAKMAGRGLGYTQGTIDKLESILGFKTSLSINEFIQNVKAINLSIMSQQEDIAKADKLLYALRDVTSTVESIPLIASSVMSKKIASGADKILLEVTCGSGAFIDDLDRAKMLSQIMVNIGKQYGKETVAIITNMDQPLGRFCGNSLEVMETIDTLNGKGEEDVVSLCTMFGAYMLKLAGVGDNLANNMRLIKSKIDNKEGLIKFRELLLRQGGNTYCIDHPEVLNKAKYKIPVKTPRSGYVHEINSKNIGMAVVNMGGGRQKKDDSIDHNVGIEILKKIGDHVEADDILMFIYCNDEELGRKQVKFLQDSYYIGYEEVPKIEAILDIID
ncbi:MAG: thymidine phosphorylase [Clostridia bacterium]|nr:thymidine phosphorylase [Clostridia bacterium]